MTDEIVPNCLLHDSPSAIEQIASHQIRRRSRTGEHAHLMRNAISNERTSAMDSVPLCCRSPVPKVVGQLDSTGIGECKFFETNMIHFSGIVQICNVMLCHASRFQFRCRTCSLFKSIMLSSLHARFMRSCSQKRGRSFRQRQ